MGMEDYSKTGEYIPINQSVNPAKLRYSYKVNVLKFRCLMG